MTSKKKNDFVLARRTVLEMRQRFQVSYSLIRTKLFSSLGRVGGSSGFKTVNNCDVNVLSLRH